MYHTLISDYSEDSGRGKKWPGIAVVFEIEVCLLELESRVQERVTCHVRPLSSNSCSSSYIKTIEANTSR